MSDKKKLYSSPRWHDPLGFNIIKEGKRTEKEEREHEEAVRLFKQHRKNKHKD